MKSIILLLTILLLISCKNDNKESVVQNPTAPGLSYVAGINDFSTTYTNLKATLQANSAISIVAEVNHMSNAQSIGKELRNTRVLFFGNPILGTPLMQSNQLAGLDLPQKMLIYQDSSGLIVTTYNSTAYLSARHGLNGVATLEEIKTALNNLASNASNGTVSENNSGSVSEGDGIVTIQSNNDFNTTYDKLKTAIESNQNLTVVAELDHMANAASVGLTLNPTRIIIFGNPNLGTPLMQNSQTSAIDLPQKMLVWENADGTVNISYNAPSYLEARHSITDNISIISQIANALNGLATTAAN